MERRNVLRGMAVAMAGSVAAGATVEAKISAAAKAGPQFVAAPADGKFLLNAPRAYSQLDQIGVDGFIAIHPINVHYLANMPVSSRFRADYPAFAIVPRDPSFPTVLVTSTAQAQDLLGSGRELPELITYAGADNWRDGLDAMSACTKAAPHGLQAEATPAKALAKALRLAGLEHGKVAVDDMRIAHALERVEFTGLRCVLGDNLIRRVRAVKTAPEVELMRTAALNNVAAAEATIRSLTVGMTAEEIERRFAAECLARGNTKTEFLAGLVHDGMPGGKIVAGRPFVIDAVSQFANYHGDFGRTVVIGEPGRDLIARDRAHRAGRDAVLEIVKPGVRFSKIARVAREALIKAGMPEHMITVNPHTVGLEHGDNPARLDVPFNVPEDLVLEENMVFTVDLPYFEQGWGGGHHEDLIRVTKTGYEALAGEGEPLIVV